MGMRSNPASDGLSESPLVRLKVLACMLLKLLPSMRLKLLPSMCRSCRAGGSLRTSTRPISVLDLSSRWTITL